jgi:hypothetical protein
MLPAALDERTLTEDLGECFVQSLGAIDHEQQRALGGKPAFNQIGESVRN